jgi:hypothetical protein
VNVKVLVTLPYNHNVSTLRIVYVLFQSDDYTRFEKDRFLTSYGFISSKRIGGTNFDDHEHTVRGLEILCDSRLGRRQLGEKKDLLKALKAEEERQKKEGTYPDLQTFCTTSRRHSKPGRERAISLAQEDARACRPRSKNQVVEALYRGMSVNRFRRRNSEVGGTGVQRRRSIA